MELNANVINNNFVRSYSLCVFLCNLVIIPQNQTHVGISLFPFGIGDVSFRNIISLVLKLDSLR